LSVVFTPTAAGPLVNQTLHIANNFDNIAEQTLSITGTAWNLASASMPALALNFGSVHVGDPVPTGSFSLTNRATGSLSESLSATVSGASGAIAIGGSVALLAPGSNNASSLAASVGSTASAGHLTGSATLNLASDGTGTSGLGQTPIGSVTLSA